MKHYTFIDYATQLYVLIVGVLVLIFHNPTVPEWPYLVSIHALGLALIHAVIRADAARQAPGGLGFLRHFYPVLLFIAFYRETGALNHMFGPDYLDPFFIRLEQRLFGRQPSLNFMHRLPYLPISELFYLAYFSYYLMIAGVGVVLFWRNRQQFQHYLAVVCFVFYVCYACYIFLPVMGPRVFFREIEGYRLPEDLQSLGEIAYYPSAVQAGPFFHLMAFIYRNFEAPGAAFPSSHVAIALCTVFFSFRYLPRLRFWHAGLVVLLCAATVYCRYHYVVDVLAGVLTAGILVPLGDWCYARSLPKIQRTVRHTGE